MAISAFRHSTYRGFLKEFFASERGMFTRAAKALGCQRSYFSRVLSGDLQITPDHAFKLTVFMKLDTGDRDYFLAMVEHERASSIEYRSHWKKRIEEMRRTNESIQERTNRKHLSIDPLQSNYFSSWIWAAIHFLTSIPKFQSVKAISERLSVSDQVVLSHLEALDERGLIENAKGRWQYKSGEFHADKHSPLVAFHHHNWRSRAVLDAQNTDARSVHYTAVQTMSFEDADRLKALMIEFIATVSQVAGPSTPEECIAITCDFFSV